MTEAGLARPRELPGCISVLLCQRVRGSAKSQEDQRFGAGGTMRFRIAFRTTRERRSREPVKTLFHSICVRPWASARPWVPSDGSRAPAWTWAACVSQEASVRASWGAEVHRNGDAARVECVSASEGRITAACVSTETGYPHQAMCIEGATVGA